MQDRLAMTYANDLNDQQNELIFSRRDLWSVANPHSRPMGRFRFSAVFDMEAVQ
jgi:hypothetical protein